MNIGVISSCVRVRLIVMGLFAAAALSCSNPPQIQFVVTGQKYMNSGGFAALVCIYQLRGQTNFVRVPLESFWREGQKDIQDDLVAPRTEIMLAPGEIREVTIELSPETRFIGAAVDFRKSEGDLWRQVHPVGREKTKTIEILVGMAGIELRD